MREFHVNVYRDHSTIFGSLAPTGPQRGRYLNRVRVFAQDEKKAIAIAVDLVRKQSVVRARIIRNVFEDAKEGLQNIAREHGYALSVHGSMARDIDLVATPWTDRASGASVLAEAIHQHLGGRMSSAEQKPHGRRAWSITPEDSPTYFDLSVSPLKPKKRWAPKFPTVARKRRAARASLRRS